jgi:molybdopterin-containing oxidoreductase family iron-sulfur binding subunit
MGGSLALAGLTTACAGEPKGPQNIAPYVNRPPGVGPDESLFYATALTHLGYAEGALVRQVAGRPVKIEGNPQHPASLGATSIFMQAQSMQFYDPDRSQFVLNKGQQKTWNDAVAALTAAASAHRANQGAGLRILTETVTSPSLGDTIQSVLKLLPSAQWHQWDPVNRDNVREGTRLAFGKMLTPQYHFDQADVVLALDSDFLVDEPGSIRYSHDWASKRTPSLNNGKQNRLYAAESAPTITGMKADNRLPALASQIEGIARAIAAGVGVTGVTGGSLSAAAQSWVAAVAKDLAGAKGASLVVAGAHQPPSVHVLAHQINAALGNVGKTVTYTNPVELNPTSQLASLNQLVQDMNGGKVDFLLVIGANPVYTAPADLGFGAALGKVAQSVHLGLFADETAQGATWHIPMAHELEAWGDARAFDGTTTIMQPLINPLYGGKTPQEVLAVLTGNNNPSSHDLVKTYWTSQLGGASFDQTWKQILSDGMVPNTALPAQTATLAASPAPAAAPATGQGYEINFRPDPTIWDGRFANNGWLQELPKPLNQVTWDNTVAVSPGSASKLGVQNGDVVTVSLGGKSIQGPISIIPGHPDDSATVYFGYGRTNAGRIGNGIGYNAYALRTSSAPWTAPGASIAKTGQTVTLANTQSTFQMEGRDIIFRGNLDEYQKDPKFIQNDQPNLVGTMYPPFPYTQNKWGMAINLSSCIGCKACEMACQAENNIPVVGKDQVIHERIMHWIRVDRYYEGDTANPTSYTMPVPCQQCENAPCEVVCPVDATIHSSDGLNDMVYNRCVGTRYCSNNCPYKVRRFNFYQFADYTTPSLQLMWNPEVSVRERGVMEKCTYCVQRIRLAQANAEIENRNLRDGEVMTACQAACPTKAITFGDLNDQGSQVAKLRGNDLSYDLLKELNTHPRTFYLGAIRNPNPAIPSGQS